VPLMGVMVMSKPRRMFGPLLNLTLLLAVLAVLYSALEMAWPRIAAWNEVRSLAFALRSDDARTRTQAQGMLMRKGEAVALPILIEATRDPREETRMLACDSLGRYRVEPGAVVPALALAAADGSALVRMEAAAALGRVAASGAARPRPAGGSTGSPPAWRATVRDPLHRLLGDKSELVRAEAVRAVGELGVDPGSAAPLARAAGDPERDVRLAAAKALLAANGAGDPTAARTLVELAGAFETTAEIHRVFEAAAVLDGERFDRVVRAMAGQLASKDPIARYSAAVGLSDVGERAKAALPALAGLAQDPDPEVRAYAGLAIATIEGKASPRAVAVLVAMVGDATLAEARRFAAIVMLRERDPTLMTRASAGLVRQLGDPDASVRNAAQGLLAGFIGEVPAEMPGSASDKRRPICRPENAGKVGLGPAMTGCSIENWGKSE